MTIKRSEVKVGDTRTQVLVEDLTRTQIIQYAGASGDFNPIHTDEIFAREVEGYPSGFAHGLLVMGMTARLMTDWAGADHLTRYGARFARQVWPGDTLTATATVESIDEQSAPPTLTADIVTKNQKDEIVLSGYVTVTLAS